MEDTQGQEDRQEAQEGLRLAQDKVADNAGDEYAWPEWEHVDELSRDAVDNHQGYRDPGLIMGAIGNTQMQQVYGMHEDVFDTAATLIAKVQRQQAVVEGNKRTAAALGLAFLEQNGWETDNLMQDGL